MKFVGKLVYDTKALKKLNKELDKAGAATVRVGVLTDKAGRDGEEFNNADIGAVHELGSKTGDIPSRSFLRTPCQVDLPKELTRIGKTKMHKLIATKGAVYALKTLGVLAEQSVDKAFETRGNGTWAPNKPATIKRKGSDMPLIDTAKLRRSVTSKVYIGSKGV